mgnify:FL=1
MFELFDPAGEVTITEHHLPHWSQPGATYFITFRTDDSIPTAVYQAWKRERDDWLRRQQINPLSRAWRSALKKLPHDKRAEYHERFTAQFHERLDDCLGACVLKRPEISGIVAKSLRHFDGDRYHLGDFVIMPNHVHLLVQLLGELDPKTQCKSWKHFTARQINKVLGQSGHFWQAESFDHLVRTPEQFDAIVRYIADNPRKARLSSGEYVHWKRK